MLTKSLFTRFAVTACLGWLLSSGGFSAADEPFNSEQRSHWAFQPVRRPIIPDVGNAEVTNPIDAFVLARLQERGLKLAPRAGKAELLRRASLDLVGLPPTLEELEMFLSDRSPKAFENAVDRLLARPQYGERWARHWLDLARYAESEGFKADETRPNAWRYRDYVIHSLNSDKPYDRFLQEQIAGDELWPKDAQALVATAFNRHYPDESNARNLMQRRQEILNDITDTVGSVFAGVTYACARCHDHKFDPILQKDYYRLQAFFANSAADDRIMLASSAEMKSYQERLAIWEERTRAVREEMAALEAPERKQVIDEFVEKYPEEIRTALAKGESERSPFECQMVAKANLYLNPASHQYIAPVKTVAGRLKGDEKKRWEELDGQLQGFAGLHPGPLPLGTGLVDLSAEAPATRLLRRGVYDAPMEEVEPGFLSILNPGAVRAEGAMGSETTGRRAALAKLLTDPANPLPVRVIVNRVWHYHFGRGIVATPSDFGLKGAPPSHPELLDWLTSEFMANGWSLKALHRLIMSSNTYQQSSDYRGEAARLDPDNRWWWRFPRQRLEGEVIRDAMLAVSGRLNFKMGGPSVFPEMPPGAETRGGWNVTDESAERDRRSIYVFVRRNTRYPMFEVFDMPDTHESCARRNTTTSPLQALTMLNSSLTLDWARSFAGRVVREAGTSRSAQIETAYRLAFSRVPNAEEWTTIEDFYQRHHAVLAERSQSGEKLAAVAGAPGPMDRIEGATLIDFCHMLMNANEFVYRN